MCSPFFIELDKENMQKKPTTEQIVTIIRDMMYQELGIYKVSIKVNGKLKRDVYVVEGTSQYSALKVACEIATREGVGVEDGIYKHKSELIEKRVKNSRYKFLRNSKIVYVGKSRSRKRNLEYFETI